VSHCRAVTPMQAKRLHCWPLGAPTERRVSEIFARELYLLAATVPLLPLLASCHSCDTLAPKPHQQHAPL
jgi:hypothetical protein